jgi:hypothetical protein
MDCQPHIGYTSAQQSPSEPALRAAVALHPVVHGRRVQVDAMRSVISRAELDASIQATLDDASASSRMILYRKTHVLHSRI